MHARRLGLLGLLAAVLALPAPAFAVDETLTVPTAYGNVWVEITRPDTTTKVPIILTYSPYNTLSENPGGNVSDDSLYATYGPLGYARAVADVIGTRNSTGCWDYGGLKEQQSGVDLVNTLARQPWSNGKVAMIGGSYDGTTANMVAARGAEVPGLAAIVPQSAINHWYGYAYQDGARYFANSDVPTDEGIDTPLGFDFGLARTPPTKPGQASVLDFPTGRYNPCDSADHTQHGYDPSPDYDQFWKDRDYIKDAAKVQVPVLVTHGWQDYNVKQSEGIDFYEALSNAPFKMLFMFQGTHEAAPGNTYNPVLKKFFDHTLKGIDNGVEKGPLVYTYGRTAGTAATKPVTEASWPPPGTHDIELQLGHQGTGTGVLAPAASGPPATLRDTGTATEERAIQEGPAKETNWLYYESMPLAAPLRIAGSPIVDADISDSAGNGQISPTLLDIAPNGTAVTIARGHMNLQYRNGVSAAVPVPVGQPIRAHVRLAPQDQTVPVGHKLGLIFATSNTVWALPDEPAGYTLTVRNGSSKLVLPVVG